MFRPCFKMLRTSLVVGMILAFPAATLARGPHHWGPPRHHHHGGGSSLGAFFFGAVTGAVVHELLSPPRDAVVVEVRGARYYRSGGYYYRPRWRGDHWVYVPVDPPPVVVAQPAPVIVTQPAPVVVQGQTYYRSPTTPYQGNTTASNPPVTAQTPKAPEVIPTPAASKPLSSSSTRPAVGSVVRQLPSGAINVRIGTTDYYAADGVYYLPVRVEGQTRYVAVDDPTRTRR